MIEINEIIQKDIDDRLATMSGVSVLDGWLVHYVSDLLSGGGEVSFPCVAVQMSTEDTLGQRPDKLSLSRTFDVVGAVSVRDPKTVNSQLNELLKSTRKVLIFDEHDNDRKAKTISFNSVEFNLPEKSDSYAFFSLNITVTYVENH